MFFDNILVGIVLSVTIILTTVWLYYKWSHQFWERRNIPTVTPKFPFGNLRSSFNVKEPEYLAIHRCYQELRAKGHKYGGIYAMTKPVFLPTDAELVRNILITDFHYFYNRAIYVNEQHDPLSAHLLALDGQRWKNMRIKLTPAFTSGKLKTMFPTMMQSSSQLMDAIAKMNYKNQPLNIKEMMACFTTDVIGSCAFGINCNSFKDPDPEFRRYGRKSFDISKFRHVQRLLATAFPNFSRFIGIPAIPRDVSKFFLSMIRNTVDARKENNIRRNDVLQILMDLNKELIQNMNQLDSGFNDGVNGVTERKYVDSVKKPLTITEIASNAFIFFLGGFETSSTTMSFCLFELSQNQDVQDRVRQEINTVLPKYDGKITYESLSEMKYMRQCFDETLRKYPITPVMKRKCTDDYKIPGTDTVIEKDTTVFISAFGLHRDPDYFPDPEKFDPERFNEENKENVKVGSYLGFGDGPRICIGKRFGITQMTIGMTKLLKDYRVKLNNRTKLPMEFEPNSFIVAPRGGIWLDLEKL